MGRSVQDQIAALMKFSPCDASDALLKLQKPEAGKVARGGYLADIVPFAPCSPFSTNKTDQPKVIAPASTLKLLDKTDTTEPLPLDHPSAIPKGNHWADMTEEGTILVIDQPLHQTCASVGGIMASRMSVRKLAGCVVNGRVRDLAELSDSGLAIWARGRSTVGTGAEAKVYGRNLPISICDVMIKPGDFIFCDPLEGVVAIPAELVDEVIDITPGLTENDDKLKADVENGMKVSDAIKKHRG